MELTWVQDQYTLAVASVALGILATVLAHRLIRKRGLFTYTVRHDRVAVSGDDATLGSVRVTWNNNSVTNLYSSTVELVNDSLKDYENVEIRVWSADTILLTERTEILGTTYFLRLTEEFAQSLAIPPGQQPTPEQIDAYGRRRYYMIPTMNRGQVVRFSYLNTTRGESGPSIWLDVLHKGVKLRYRVPSNEMLGVPQPHAAFFGALLGFAFVVVLVNTVRSVAVIAGSALAFGLIAQLPGALAVRAWRRLRFWLAD